jgi:RimJ/RimL family protein N-acetyltransferase
MIAPTLQTQRLVIQPSELRDAHAMFAYRSDQSVQRYQFWRPDTQGEVEDLFGKYTNWPLTQSTPGIS